MGGQPPGWPPSSCSMTHGVTEMALTTTVSGVWTLQALLGVETMPAVLRVKPFVPSVHESLIVETTAGPLPLSETGEYLGLVAAGVIDSSGAVDDVVRDWMTVLGRPERQVVLPIRPPAPNPPHPPPPPLVPA